MVEQATNSLAFEQTKNGKQKVYWFVCTGVMLPSFWVESWILQIIEVVCDDVSKLTILVDG